MIKFYFHHTPNPMKVALFLEEAGLDYEVVPIDLFKGQQHLADFTKINPNAKLPVIQDGDDTVFDSNAILLYLSEKYGKFGTSDAHRADFLSWYMFIATGVGPYSGQCVHFTHFYKESDYAKNRYRKEVERHYGILNDRLAGREYIVGGDYTIADISGWGWVSRANFILEDENALDAWPNLKRWFGDVDGRDAVARANTMKDSIEFKDDFDEETLRAMFPQNYAAA